MFATKIPHVSLSKRNGYVWRKSYKGKYLYIALRTRNEQEAISRGVDVSVRFLDLSSLSIPYDAIYQSLKSYRDEIVRHVTVSRLTAIKNAYAAPQALYAP